MNNILLDEEKGGDYRILILFIVLGACAALLAFWGTISIIKGIFYLSKNFVIKNLARNLRLRHARVQSELQAVRKILCGKYSE